MIRDELKKEIEAVLGQEVKLEHPAEPSHGDYSSNIAMTIFSKSEARSTKHETNYKFQISKFKTPLELAQAIALEIGNWKLEILDRVGVAPPGFINFWLGKSALSRELELALKVGERYGTHYALPPTHYAKKIMLEFTDPNPFKLFHIGHLYSNTVGEALSRLFEAQGAVVWRVNYQGDVGLHVAKAIWGFRHKIRSTNIEIRNLQKKPLAERVRFLGESYALGNKAYEEDPEARREIEELNRKVYAKDPEIQELYQKGREWSLQYFDTVYNRLGTKFKRLYFESEAGETGLKLVKKHLKDGIFRESEGAVIFPGKKYGLHNRVFINKQGLPTYEAKDMGLAPTKYKDFAYDESYIVTGNEQAGYFKVVLRALQEINPELGKKTQHIPHGMVRLPAGKMGSRTGDVITAEWLLDEAKERVRALVNRQKTKDKSTDVSMSNVSMSSDERERIAELVAIGAVKYALLRAGIGKDVIFDFEKSLSFEGDSGPYLQYTHARCRSVLQRAQIRSTGSAKRTFPQHEILNKFKIQNYKLNPEEEALLRTFYRFPEVVQDAAEGFAPNLLCNFLFDLAQKYNTFYNKHRIIDPDETTDKRQQTREFRLALNIVVGNILKSGLGLLGIEAPERM